MDYKLWKNQPIRIIFVLWDLYSEPFGVLQLASFLKKHSYEVLLCEADIQKIKALIRPHALNILALSVPTAYSLKCINFARYFKNKFTNILTIAGGPHPTLYPEFIFNQDIDIICRGEGEYAFLELLQSLKKGESFAHTKNLWIKNNFSIYKNTLRPLIDDLDKLPFPDRSSYQIFYPHILKRMAVIFSRGCMFNCSFCMNAEVRRLYGVSPELFFRVRSAENAVKEMQFLKEKFKCEEFFIHDDIFGYNIEWLEMFTEYYKNKVRLPFHCNMHPSYVTEERLGYLKKANCTSITIGIESGSDYVRNSLLSKGVTTKTIKEAADKIHKHGISLRTTSIFGFPGNTINDEWETVKLNLICKPRIFRGYLLSFYPGFILRENGRTYQWNEKEFTSKTDGIGMVLWSKYQKESIFQRQKKLLALCHILVAFPVLFPARNILMKLPLGRVFIFGVKLIRLDAFINFIQKKHINIPKFLRSALFFITIRCKNIKEAVLLKTEKILRSKQHYKSLSNYFFTKR